MMNRAKKFIIPCVIVVFIIAAAIALTATGIIPHYRDSGYDIRPSGKVEEVLELMEEYGAVVDALPCVDGEVEVRLERQLSLWMLPSARGSDAGLVLRVNEGDVLVTDFLSYSDIRHGGWRKVSVKSGGSEYSGYCETSSFTRLYMDYISQNGLEERFQQETGKKFNRSSAGSAIKSVDRLAYEAGLWNPADYPISSRASRAAGSSVILLLVAIPVLRFVVVDIRENRRYREYLRVWNEEGRERWLELYGNLPQFQSLKQSGIGDEYRWIIRKRSLPERIADAFRPKSTKNN